MPRKQKKKKRKRKERKTKEKSPQFVMIPREINAVKIWTQLLPIGHLKFFFQISYEKVWDTLTALNFINSAKSSVINKSLYRQCWRDVRFLDNFFGKVADFSGHS